MDFSWLWIVPVLGLLVLVHEAGHFFTARMFGIRVEEFAIGLPPRAFAIRRNGIDYSINWLPIGGFVKILGENGDSDAPDSFGRAPAWQRIVVLAAGVTMNLLTALILFFIFFMMGRDVSSGPPMIGQVTDASGPAAVAGLTDGDIVLAINTVPMTSVTMMRDTLEQQRGKATEFVIDRAGKTITTTVTPRSEGLALGIAFGPEQRGPVSVQQVDESSVAYANGLRPGDVLVSVNDSNVPTLDRLNLALENAKSAFDTAKTPEDQRRVAVVYRRGSEELPAIQVNIVNQGGLQGVVVVTPITHEAFTVTEAVSRSFGTIGALLVAIPTQLGQVFSGQASTGDFAGPIGIAQITGEVSRQSGLEGLLWLTAVLGVNLALINILPLPALDGGRIMFILVEILRGGRKIAPEKEGLVHLVGMGLLLLLILLISLQDIGRLISGRSFMP
jgi:regulator of sigma E protease